jgi:hypothetical protein
VAQYPAPASASPLAINSAGKFVEAGGSIGAMLDRQAKARNTNAPRTHSPTKPMAIVSHQRKT